MGDKLLDLITGSDPSWDRRWRYNCAIFLISYIFMGAVTGITNDTYVSYLELTVPDVVKALPMYSSIATFVMAMGLFLVHRYGYKKIIILAPLVLIAALLACIYSRDDMVLLIANILVNIGAGMFDFIYPMMYTSYAPKEHRVSLFARVMYCNLISQSILTFFNGKIVVWKFSQYMNISYDQASNLSEHPALLSASSMVKYICSYEFALWIAIAFTALSLICLFFLREQVSDYQETKEERDKRQSEKKFDWRLLCNKYIVMWIIAFSIIRFGALLVTPYFPIYLNNFLHISRGTVSTIITMQTLSMVLGYLAAPYLEKKLGSIVSISLFIFLCIPLMLLMANGMMFGANIAWCIGIILFLRSGIANATAPIEQSLPLTFMSKDLVPAYSSFMLIANSAVGIIAGLYARYWLLATDSGYATAYYVTSVFYIIAAILIFAFFFKKYNRGLSDKEIDNDKEIKQAEI